jgi:hypothetical protein
VTSASPEDPVLLLANVGVFGDVPALVGRQRGAYAEPEHLPLGTIYDPAYLSASNSPTVANCRPDLS